MFIIRPVAGGGGGGGGGFAHGQPFTLTGSGFGTQPQQTPLKYEDAQSVGLGAGMINSTAPGPAWIYNGNVTANDINPVASNAKLRPGTPFTRNMLCTWSNPPTPAQGVSNLSLIAPGISTITTYYFDAWFYFDTTGVTSGSPQNIKPVRLHNTGATAPSANWATPFGADSTDSWAWRQIDGVDNNSSWSQVSTSFHMINAWVHVQWGMKAGSGNGTADGGTIAYVDCTKVFDVQNYATTTGGQSGWPEMYWGNYVRNGLSVNGDEFTGNVRCYWECGYHGLSWARVELGDNATYANCTHREIQPFTAWSNTSITITGNRGSFPVGNTPLYLFVTTNSNVSTMVQSVTVTA